MNEQKCAENVKVKDKIRSRRLEDLEMMRFLRRPRFRPYVPSHRLHKGECPCLASKIHYANRPDNLRTPSAVSEEITGTEDCLFLNVFAPGNKTNLPVMIWIHGGGYGIGSAAAFDFSYMNKASGNKFMFITIQYRLGAFGFLSSEAVSKHGVVNAGLHDQRLAFEWVQEHIQKFGGDPDEVTIAGESAGAGSVMHAAIANGGSDGDRLWKRGIVSSLYMPAQWIYNDQKPSEMYQKFAETAGCLPSNLSLVDASDSSIFRCLQNADTETLQRASAVASQHTTYGQWGFAPVTDYNLIRDRPTRLLSKGRVNGRRMLVGHNANEGTYFTFGALKFPFPIRLEPNFFVPQNITTQEEFVEFTRSYYPLLSNDDVSRILSLYSPDAHVDAGPAKFASNGLTPPFSSSVSNLVVGWQQAANNLYAEATFVCPSYWIADAYSSESATNSSSLIWAKALLQVPWLHSGPTPQSFEDNAAQKQAWLYQFSVPDALHGTDLEPLLDDSQADGEGTMNSAFRRGFQQIWSQFILRGNPVLLPERVDDTLMAASQEIWTPWGENERQHLLVLNVTESRPHLPDWMVSEANHWEGGRRKRCSLWNDLGDKIIV